MNVYSGPCFVMIYMSNMRTVAMPQPMQEHDLMDVGDFEQHRFFSDKEEEFVKHEEVTLNGFQVCLQTWVPISSAKDTLLVWDRL